MMCNKEFCDIAGTWLVLAVFVDLLQRSYNNVEFWNFQTQTYSEKVKHAKNLGYDVIKFSDINFKRSWEILAICKNEYDKHMKNSRKKLQKIFSLYINVGLWGVVYRCPCLLCHSDMKFATVLV